MKKKPISVYNNLLKYNAGEISISSITLAELYYGVQKSSKKYENQNALIEFIKPFEIVNFDFNASIVYGEIRSNLERKGKVIGNMDLLISSIAISNDLTLITNNMKEFERIDNLKFENWI